MPRLGDPKTILALAVLVLAAMVVKAEFWPDPIDQPKESPGAEAGLLAQNAKPVTGSAGGPGPEEKDAPSPQEECPDAEVVWEGIGTGDLDTNLFETRTDRFIVSYEVLNLQVGGALPSLYATVEDGDGQNISSGEIPSPQPGDRVRIDLRPNMGRTIVDTEPGSYKVAVSPSKADRRYAVLVEECQESPT